jgi:hypothetical protein
LSVTTLPDLPTKRIYRTRDILRLNGNISDETLRRWCRENKFPRPTKHHNRLIWDALVVDAFLEGVLQGNTPAHGVSSKSVAQVTLIAPKRDQTDADGVGCNGEETHVA